MKETDKKRLEKIIDYHYDSKVKRGVKKICELVDISHEKYLKLISSDEYNEQLLARGQKLLILLMPDIINAITELVRDKKDIKILFWLLDYLGIEDKKLSDTDDILKMIISGKIDESLIPEERVEVLKDKGRRDD